MVKSCLISALLLGNQFRSTVAFSSIGGPRPTSVTSVGFINLAPTRVPKPSLDSHLLASPIDGDDVLVDNAVQKRRAFLANFAATSLLPVVAFATPATAFGFGTNVDDKGLLVFGGDDIMSQKDHGTTSIPVQDNLRYGVSRKLADKICSFNRHFAENGGYFEGNSSFEKDVREIVASTGEPVTFYDSVSGKSLFKAPVGRSVDEFINESKVHGWPSFRDEEVDWSNVRVLKSSGETVSTVGTHLGHNLPDRSGNRYCINLVSVAGNP